MAAALFSFFCEAVAKLSDYGWGQFVVFPWFAA